MDNETKLLLAEHLTASELVEFLQVRAIDAIDAFEEVILDNYKEVMEYIGVPTTTVTEEQEEGDNDPYGKEED